MKPEYSREEIERYLLGEGEGAVREAIGEALIVDSELHALVREVENDRIDALAQGQLPEAQARAWRGYLEQTGQTKRLAVARALMAKARPRLRRYWWLEAAAALFIAAGAGWFWLGPKAKIQPVLEARQVSLTLPRGTTRGNDAALRLEIGSDVARVEFRFEVAPEPASGYRVRVLSASEKVLLVREGRGWPESPLRVTVEARDLPEGLLRLELLALDSAGAAAPVGFYEVAVRKASKR